MSCEDGLAMKTLARVVCCSLPSLRTRTVSSAVGPVPFDLITSTNCGARLAYDSIRSPRTIHKSLSLGVCL